MDKNAIKKLADQLLGQAGVTNPPVPVVEIARAEGIKVRFGPLPDELSGVLVHERGETFIGVNSLHSPRRQTFTIAHELGHYALHPRTNFVDHKILYFRNSLSGQAQDLKEMEANEFAASLLMPAKLLAKSLKGETVDLEDDENIESLAKKFGVSTQALTFRLINLNLARHG